MLYKNLPQRELAPVMRVRCVLDYVAALKFLLTGCIGDFKAVINARREFKRIKSEYAAKRDENLAATLTEYIPERSRFSILWRYYACRCKHFAKLK